jgi:hypothetical protein
MRDDFFIWATLSPRGHEILDKHISPLHESSHWKGIPIEHLAAVKKALRASMIPVRYKFRGPRYDLSRGTCLAKNAKTFAVYPR